MQILISFKALEDACKFLKDLLDKFDVLSRLCVNHDKSVVVFSPNMNSIRKANCGQILRMKIDTQIGRYLGVYIDGHRPLQKNFDVLVDRIKSRLSGWKMKCLSQTGRLTLLKSVIQADPVYKLVMRRKLTAYAPVFSGDTMPQEITPLTCSVQRRSSCLGVKEVWLLRVLNL